MKVRYTKHAQAKFTVLKNLGWNISKIQIRKTITAPKWIGSSRFGQKTAMRLVDKSHILRRVIMNQENDIIVVGTFHIAKGENMKVHYSQQDDILMIELNKKKVDDAYETGNMIVHVSKDREPVLLRFLMGSKMLKETFSKLPKKVIKSILLPSFPALSQKVT